MPLAELTRRAMQVLAREFGPADAARFVGQFSNGSGDYTADRNRLFAGVTLDDILADIQTMREAGHLPPLPPGQPGG
jgi:hypothetical protein